MALAGTLVIENFGYGSAASFQSGRFMVYGIN